MGKHTNTIETMPDQQFFEQMFPHEEIEDGGKHLSHLINPPGNLHIWEEGMTSQEIVEIARLTGQKVVALCGYVWIPKRDPKKHPPCNKCIQIAMMMVVNENG